MSVLILFAIMGTIPLTAYSASLTFGFTYVQKKLLFLVQNDEDIWSSLFIKINYNQKYLIDIISEFKKLAMRSEIYKVEREKVFEQPA